MKISFLVFLISALFCGCATNKREKIIVEFDNLNKLVLNIKDYKCYYLPDSSGCNIIINSSSCSINNISTVDTSVINSWKNLEGARKDYSQEGY